MPGQRQAAKGEDAQPFVGVEADPVIGRGNRGASPWVLRHQDPCILDHRHIRPQREQAVELTAQRHVAVPGYDAQLDGGLRVEFYHTPRPVTKVLYILAHFLYNACVVLN